VISAGNPIAVVAVHHKYQAQHFLGGRLLDRLPRLVRIVPTRPLIIAPGFFGVYRGENDSDARGSRGLSAVIQ
jgi:hypothetical protein